MTRQLRGHILWRLAGHVDLHLLYSQPPRCVSVVSCSTTKPYTATVRKTAPKSSGVCYCFRTFETMTTIWVRK
ncbi:hypothetical protein HBH69_048410 [Parastagonospora nodorum]|nr:hypothetical protein HBI03_058410 [Parastagonospora nodorum]KAH4987732.1 hypothetical protein HBI76_098150 [Parastagonospora nodorum]KAH5160326.1 hypothetical protein HBH69_048410 [Parastagonospora nodorum]KAH5219231.1 hypothetical protein HBH68_046230 [Parastagonospora nodorum]KAH5423037.1 hypothetical protein HBI46_068260 [Parastagonospora nodorum]